MSLQSEDNDYYITELLQGLNEILSLKFLAWPLACRKYSGIQLLMLFSILFGVHVSVPVASSE